MLVGAFRRWGVEPTVPSAFSPSSGAAPHKATKQSAWRRKGDLPALDPSLYNNMIIICMFVCLMIEHVNTDQWKLKDFWYLIAHLPLELMSTGLHESFFFFFVFLQTPRVNILEYLCHLDSLKMVICFDFFLWPSWWGWTLAVEFLFWWIGFFLCLLIVSTVYLGFRITSLIHFLSKSALIGCDSFSALSLSFFFFFN